MSSIDTTMERVLAAEVLCIESFLMGLQRLRSCGGADFQNYRLVVLFLFSLDFS